MDIAIVGAGIAGLALALNLKQRGINPRVYEAAPEILELGVGITLLPHAMREIANIGLDSEMLAAGIENQESAYFNRFGQKLFSEPRGKYAGYPFPEVGIHRGRLHGILYRAALERLGSERVFTNHQFTALEQDDVGVSLHFRTMVDNTVLEPVRADIVIACDGINSAIRRQFYPSDQIAFGGINTWRGVTRRKPILGGRTYLRIGSIRTGKIVIYPIVDDVDGEGLQLINWMAEIEGQQTHKNDWNKPGRAEDILPIYDSFKFDWLDVGALIRESEMILEYPMVDKDPIDRWTFGRVTFAGDAAHPMYPRGSNGSAQAMIDARTLADLLASELPLDALARYESIRAPLTAEIVRTNRMSPPDVLNMRVEELTGDRPFDNLDSIITQDELRELSERYKQIAGFAISDVT